MDVEQVHRELTQGSDVPPIKATDVERFVQSSITFWCQVHAPRDMKDPINPDQQRRFDIGNEHQREVLHNLYGDAVQKFFADEEQGFQTTLDLMAAGVPAIHDMPLICLPEGVEGRPDVLQRVDGVESDLGPYSYCVVEIKSSKAISPAHRLQGAVYNRMLGRVQGFEPAEFYMMNRNWEMEAVLMSQVVDDLERVLLEMREIISGKSVEPCHGSGLWPWKSYIDSLAIARNDVSLITGVGASKRQPLVAAGLSTVDLVAAAPEEELTRVRGIGGLTARKFKTSAQAILEERPVRRQGTLDITSAGTQVFFDLEGTENRRDGAGLAMLNYLIGTLLRRSSETPVFRPFFAASVEYEEVILREFFDWAESLDDAKFYHWHHYEPTNLRKMTSYYGLNPDQVANVMGRFVDLSPITTGTFAFPAYGEGLKDIAKCLGFSWRQDDVNALNSMALYDSFVESGGVDTDARDKILIYNEDDCRATMHVYDWLLSQQI